MKARQGEDETQDTGGPSSMDGAAASRSLMVERWLTLTRQSLPSMAVDHRWPIKLDHCFMRVCLDEVFGTPWSDTIARPAIRTMSDAQIKAAVEVAEAIVARPTLLVELNRRSLNGRRAKRRQINRRAV